MRSTTTYADAKNKVLSNYGSLRRSSNSSLMEGTSGLDIASHSQFLVVTVNMRSSQNG